MKVLILSQYFWPESFRINDFTKGLIEKGHEVEVLTGKPNYPKGEYFGGYSFSGYATESWEGIKIHRVPLIKRKEGGAMNLILNYFSFVFYGTVGVFRLKQKYDHIFVFVPSPLTAAVPALLYKKFKRNVPVSIWLQDLWPETITSAGGITNKLVLSFAKSISLWIYNKSDHIFTQSEGFIKALKAKGISANKMSLLPNYTEEFYVPLRREDSAVKDLPEGKKIMFAGNIGECQDFDSLLNVCDIVKKDLPDLKWVILGDGRRKPNVIKAIKEKGLKDNFIIMGRRKPELMPHYFSQADALVLSLQDQPIFRITIPSKLQSYMACGKPILGSIIGEAADVIEKAEAGLTSSPMTNEDFAEKIKSFYEFSENQRMKMGENALSYYKEFYSRDSVLEKFNNALEIMNK